MSRPRKFVVIGLAVVMALGAVLLLKNAVGYANRPNDLGEIIAGEVLVAISVLGYLTLLLMKLASLLLGRSARGPVSGDERPR